MKRSDGHNVIARAAYNARERLVDARTNQVYDYRHLGETEWKGIFNPEHAPGWAGERDKLWNAVELREDQSTRPDQAQLARDFKIALPHELNAEQRVALVSDYARELARKGMVLDVAIHAPHVNNDDRNFHAHMLLTMREIGPEGLGNKVRAWNTTKEFNSWMQRWSELGAEHLERAGFKQEAQRFRTGHLSRRERAKLAHERGDLAYFERLLNEPQQHRGPEVSAMQNKGRRTRKGEINREIEARNQVRGIPREIREAYFLSSDAQAFAEALERKDMMLARITKDDARKQVVEFAFTDTYVPQYREGEYVIATERGRVYRLTGMTTGDSFKGIRDFTKPLDQQDCPSLEAATSEMKKRSLVPKIDRDTVIAGMTQQARIVEIPLEELPPAQRAKYAPEPGVTVPVLHVHDPSPGEPRTALPYGANMPNVRGDGNHVWWAFNSTKTPEAFQQSLKDRNIELARVTAEDASDSKTEHWVAMRHGRYHPILKEGEYVAVNERGFAYRLDNHSVGHELREVKAFMGGLDSRPVQSLREAQNVVEERRIEQAVRDQKTGRSSAPTISDQPLGLRAASRSLRKALDFVIGPAEAIFAPTMTPEERKLTEVQERARRAADEQAMRHRRNNERER